MVSTDWSDGSEVWPEKERVRCVIGSIAVTVGASADVLPLIAAHLQRAAVLVLSDMRVRWIDNYSSSTQYKNPHNSDVILSRMLPNGRVVIASPVSSRTPGTIVLSRRLC